MQRDRKEVEKGEGVKENNLVPEYRAVTVLSIRDSGRSFILNQKHIKKFRGISTWLGYYYLLLILEFQIDPGC